MSGQSRLGRGLVTTGIKASNVVNSLAGIPYPTQIQDPSKPMAAKVRGKKVGVIQSDSKPLDRKARKKLEHLAQKALFDYLAALTPRIPGLAWAFSPKNDFKRTGSARDFVIWNYLKSEGVRSGVPDVFIPMARKGFHALFIEMKAPGGTASDSQKAFQSGLRANGNRSEIIHVKESEPWTAAFEAAKAIVDDYFSDDLRRAV